MSYKALYDILWPVKRHMISRVIFRCARASRWWRSCRVSTACGLCRARMWRKHEKGGLTCCTPSRWCQHDSTIFRRLGKLGGSACDSTKQQILCDLRLFYSVIWDTNGFLTGRSRDKIHHSCSTCLGAFGIILHVMTFVYGSDWPNARQIMLQVVLTLELRFANFQV